MAKLCSISYKELVLANDLFLYDRISFENHHHAWFMVKNSAADWLFE